MAGASGEEKSRVIVTSTGYCYCDASSSVDPHVQSHLVTQLQSFVSNPEICNSTAGMEMIGFPSKNLNQQGGSRSVLWTGFFNKPGNGEPTSSEFCRTDFGKQPDLTAMSDTTNENLMVSPQSSSAWSHQQQQNRLLTEDSSLRCVFPCEENERPIQGKGLSLSLSTSNPSSIGLLSFELRQSDDSRFGPSNSRSANIQPRHPQVMQGSSEMRNSKYLGPAQELLNEFCNLDILQADNASKLKVQKRCQWPDNVDAVKNQSLYSLDLLELQKRKTKLLQMLEEVNRRYKHYCHQMKALESSFEAVAGNGAATVYSSMASTAMSRHFRFLKDGIVSQIKATKKAIGEKGTAAPGATKGETPRLRLLDQTMRRQRAFQQMNTMESHPWRPQRGLPERSISVLRAWLFEHFLHPYPSDVDKHTLARQTGLSRSQVSNWFINARVRLWKPMVEAMYLEDLKDSEGMGALDSGSAANLDDNNYNLQNQNHDPRPAQDQLIRIESDCLSSIVNKNPRNNDGEVRNKSLDQSDQHQQHCFSRVADEYGAMQFDFSSYSHHPVAGRSSAPVSYLNGNTARHNFGGGGGGGTGGVSLTLELHQHGGGVGLGFSPASQPSSLFYPRDQTENCQTVQYSFLDSDQSQSQPYRNLVGAQLLHDLAG